MSDVKQLATEIESMSNTLATVYQTYTTYINSLSTLYGRIMGGMLTHEEIVQDRAKINEIFTILNQYNIHFGSVVNKFNTQTGPQVITQLGVTGTKAQLVYDLIKLADSFDDSENCMIANEIDNFLKTASEFDELRLEIKDLRDLVFALISRVNGVEKIQQKAEVIQEITKLANFSDEIGAYTLANELDKMAGEVAEPFQQPYEGSLSTRYCPDHNGVQAIRISERIYQCPIDGKVYNYEVGYTNYQGQKVPGGSIAAQTPTSSDFGGIPMRVYDSRQTILNRVN